tara:strand:+ start:9178 stop:11319 length:2142 start_codon:yes stop_codon:yes gene_type:complete
MAFMKLKSDLVAYFNKFGTSTSTGTAKFSSIDQYSKKVDFAAAESSPLYNLYPIGFLPNNPFGRIAQGFNPNLITNLIPKNSYYDKRRGSGRTYKLPKAYKDRASRDRVTLKSEDTGQTLNMSNWYVAEQSISPLSALYNSSQYYGDELNFRASGVTPNRNSWGNATDQPYILRGIQRKDSRKRIPQRWGFGSGFDDGLVRGGIVTAVDRAAHDALRIGKFLISPKGLLFNVKQVGLQLTNPKVEKNILLPGPLGRRTRIYNLGVNTLAQVAGNFAGLHVPRHGIFGLTPPLDNPAKYEKVVKGRNKQSKIPSGPGLINKPFTLLNNRLIQLTGDLIKPQVINLPGADKLVKGLPIPLLSGIAGPKSVYGIGVTNIRRYTDTRKHNEFYPNPTDLINQGSVGNIGKYATLSYGGLVNSANRNSRDVPNDFRRGAPEISLQSQADLANYKEINADKKFGMGNLGAIGANRNYPYGEAHEPTGLGDRINALLVNEDLEESTTRDYVKFKFKDVDDNVNYTMVFRATFGSITDNLKPEWSPTSYMGRPDPVYVYGGYSRDISFEFKVYSDTRENMNPMWQKLNKLASYTTPMFDSKNRAASPIMRLTLGDYIVNQAGFLSSLTLSTDAGTPWEINIEKDDNMFELPKIINVSVNYTIINEKLPQRTAWFFGDESLAKSGTPGEGAGLGNKWLTITEDEKESTETKQFQQESTPYGN